MEIGKTSGSTREKCGVGCDRKAGGWRETDCESGRRVGRRKGRRLGGGSGSRSVNGNRWGGGRDMWGRGGRGTDGNLRRYVMIGNLGGKNGSEGIIRWGIGKRNRVSDDMI